MKTSIFIALMVLLLTLAFASPVAALKGKPDFAPHIYADGVAWGTKVTAIHKAPNGHNDQSYDKLYVITNGVGGQLPVGEAAPGNPMYNGGRWWTHTVTWNVETTPVLLTSLDDINTYSGDLTITEGSFDGGPPPYFSCPLLPVK